MGKNSKDNSLELYEEVIKILVRYKDYVSRPRYIGFSSVSKTNNEDAISYVNNVNRALVMLSKEDRTIIENEFIRYRIDPLWWMNYYSRSTYYRRRTAAIKSFMEIYAQ